MTRPPIPRQTRRRLATVHDAVSTAADTWRREVLPGLPPTMTIATAQITELLTDAETCLRMVRTEIDGYGKEGER